MYLKKKIKNVTINITCVLLFQDQYKLVIEAVL
jgi:hypothetical protein